MRFTITAATLPALSALLSLVSPAAAGYLCVGTKEEDECFNDVLSCLHSFSLTATDGADKTVEIDLNGTGHSRSDLCGKTFGEYGKLDCHGDVNAKCAGNVATINGLTCRTHCDSDKAYCKYKAGAGFQISSYYIAADLICT